MVVLCSNEAITDLVEKRSSIYADRVRDKAIFTFRPNIKCQPQTTMMEL